MEALTLSDSPKALGGRVTAAIDVRGLSHRYPVRKHSRRDRRAEKSETGAKSGASNRAALDDVTFQVQPGEIFAILGPNGGGKTTLFRILSTMLRPVAGGESSGSAAVFGHDVLREAAQVRRQLGVVFQMPSLDGKLTAYENLLHQGHLYGLRGQVLAARIDEWLDRVNLLDRKHAFVEQFSGGMRRRVEVAKALLHQPRLLMMDEPATGLDPGARRDLWRDLRELRQSHGVTIAFTTHLMDEADRCDRVAILSRGKLVALDTPGNLKARIGGDVVTVEPEAEVVGNSARRLAEMIGGAFGPWEEGARPQAVDGRVRFEKAGGMELAGEISRLWPGRVRSVTVGQPTLEDVFLRLTGSALRGDGREHL